MAGMVSKVVRAWRCLSRPFVEYSLGYQGVAGVAGGDPGEEAEASREFMVGEACRGISDLYGYEPRLVSELS